MTTPAGAYETRERKVWLDLQDAPEFGPSRTAPETKFMAKAQVGWQSGTYFKTSRIHEGMIVWRWGRRDPEDCRPSGNAPSQRGA